MCSCRNSKSAGHRLLEVNPSRSHYCSPSQLEALVTAGGFSGGTFSNPKTTCLSPQEIGQVFG